MDIRTPHFELALPRRLEERVGEAMDGLGRERIVSRIWAKDWTVWKPSDDEISSRLGWLKAPEDAGPGVADLEAFAAGVRDEGFRKALLIGMGGSSLAPEVFGRMFPVAAGGLGLEVLDTTAPESVLEAAAGVDFGRTLFVVSSKSGTTAELLALFCYFYDAARKRLGEGRAGGRFAAITDPGTPLERSAQSLRFRRVFHGSADVGGRFSALTAFGLVPAALQGLDLRRLLASAAEMAGECRRDPPSANPGAVLGAVLGLAALEGRDKLILNVPPEFGPLAAWLEQLIAESTGKEGRGILPVVEKRTEGRTVRGKDLVFIEFCLPGVPPSGPDLSGSPLVRIPLADPYALGGQFFLWEMATAVAGRFLAINPFDQPDVEATKKKTREVLAGPESAARPIPDPAAIEQGVRIYAQERPVSLSAALRGFLGPAGKGDYIAVQAFLPPTAEIREKLELFAGRLCRAFPVPVTVGFGPQFLHSTGQLHKGDRGRGLFLQLAAAGSTDVPIPDVPGIGKPAPSFGALFSAQSWGDWMALREKGRRIIRLEFEGPAAGGLETLALTI